MITQRKFSTQRSWERIQSSRSILVIERYALDRDMASISRPWRSPLVALCAVLSIVLVLALPCRYGSLIKQAEGAWLRGVRLLPPTAPKQLAPTLRPKRPTNSLLPLPLLLPAEEAAAFDPRLAAAAVAAADSPAAAAAAAALPRLQDGLRGALIDAVSGGTPALLSFVGASSEPGAAASSSQHLEPFLRSLALVGGSELASTSVVACADEVAQAACEAARAATAGVGGAEARCVSWAPLSSSSSASSPAASSSSSSWAPIELVAEAVGAGFAVIYASPQSRFVADPRFALRRLAEGRLAEVAVGTKASSPARAAGAAAAAAVGGRRRGLAVVETSWDPSLIAARSSPGARALLAAWLASAKGEREEVNSLSVSSVSADDPASRLAEAAAAATAAVSSPLELAALPATAWAYPAAGCRESAEGEFFAKGVVRTIAASSSSSGVGC